MAATKKATKKATTKKATTKKATTKKAAKVDYAWQEAALQRMRELIVAALPDVVEEVKWRKPTNPDGVPTWSRGGLICTGETYKDHVRMTFLKGDKIPDPTGIFNSGFAGVRRVILLREGDKVDAKAFKALMRAAAALNGG